MKASVSDVTPLTRAEILPTRGAVKVSVSSNSTTQGNRTMKRLIAAVSFAVLATPVLAAEVSAPFEQTEFDRHVINVERASAGATGASGNVWANDYNFIAPAK
jgi:hypothetical protein